MLTRWVCTSTHSCDDISDYLDSRPSRCWKFSSIRLIESFIFLSRLGRLQRRTQEMWTGWVQSLKSFFLTDQIDPPPSAAPIALITSCSDNKSVKCQNRAAVKKKKNLLPTRRENQDECLRLNHQDRQLRRFTELDIAFSNFTVCSVWSAATSLICRRHFVSVCGPASRWALWNPAELFHHFHQSINQTLFVHISVDVNTVSLHFSILQVIFCQKFLLRHVMFLPVVSLHGVCVSYWSGSEPCSGLTV